MQIKPIDLSSKKSISFVWKEYFNEFEMLKPLKLIKVFNSFVLVIDLHIVRGNISYEPSLQLLSLTTKGFKFANAPLFYQNFRDDNNILIWIKFEDPIDNAKQYFKSIENQTLLPVFGNVKYSQLIEKMKFVIGKGLELTGIGIPFYQFEFLIHQAALNPNLEEGLKLFEFSINELKKYNKERLEYFVNDTEIYFNKLEDEFRDPGIIRSRIEENKSRLKLDKFIQHDFIY